MADQTEGSLKGLFGIERRCINFQRIRGGLQRCHGAIGVLRIPVADFGFHLGGVGGDTARREFQKAPAGAFSDTGGDEKLHPRIGEDHRADIPPIQHRTLRGAKAALEIQQGRAHGGDGGHFAGCHICKRATQITAGEVFWCQGASFGFGMFQTLFVPNLFRQAAALAYAPMGQIIPSDTGTFAMGMRKPVGVVGLKRIEAATAEYFGYIGVKSCWGKGIGSAMLDFAEKQAGLLGLRRLEIRVINDNPRARTLYLRRGFTTYQEGAGYSLMAKKIGNDPCANYRAISA